MNVKYVVLAILPLSFLYAIEPAVAVEYSLSQMKPVNDVWRIDNKISGVKGAPYFSVTTCTLHGGRQEGVTVIEIDNGKMKVRVCPTRGMGVLDAVSSKVRLGWNSPIKEIINPAFINLEANGGTGWAAGFNELVARCGYEWAGHPGLDNGEMLTLHGKAQNTPASDVKLVIDDVAPYTIRLSGIIREQQFKKTNFATKAELAIRPGSSTFHLHDVLTNQGDYTKEYMVLYHSNSGPPLLQKGSLFVAPVKRVDPFNDYARRDLKTWKSYRGPTQNFDEMVYNVYPYADPKGNTLAVLCTPGKERGVSLGYNVNQLPYLSLWKNTDTIDNGYVTGLEPGTQFAYNRHRQRPLGLIRKIGPRQSIHFDLSYTMLEDKSAVKNALYKVNLIQGKKPTSIHQEPTVDLSRPLK